MALNVVKNFIGDRTRKFYGMIRANHKSDIVPGVPIFDTAVSPSLGTYEGKVWSWGGSAWADINCAAIRDQVELMNTHCDGGLMSLQLPVELHCPNRYYSFSLFASIFPVWRPSTVYAVNDIVIIADETALIATAGGTSSGTEPTGAGTDGGVTWAVHVYDENSLESYSNRETLEWHTGMMILDLVINNADADLAVGEVATFTATMMVDGEPVDPDTVDGSSITISAQELTDAGVFVANRTATLALIPGSVTYLVRCDTTPVAAGNVLAIEIVVDMKASQNALAPLCISTVKQTILRVGPAASGVVTPGDISDIADAVWDEAIAGHLTAGSTGATLNAAGSAGDPWITPLPGAYAAGTAGNIIGNRLDVAVSTRLAPTVPGNTLDVTAAGNAGIDWGNVANQATVVSLSGTTILWNPAWDAEVQSEVDDALVVHNLDHLVGTAVGIPAVISGTYLDQIMDDGTAVYDRTTDSLQAIRDRGDVAWITGAGGDPWLTLLPGAYGAGTAGNILGNRLDVAVSTRLAPTVAGRTLDVTVGGNAGIDWANVEAPTTSLALTGTTIAWNAIWDTEVQSEVDDALVVHNLDHLVGTATGIPAVVSGTYLDQIMDNGVAVYDRTTDSLQAIRDRGDIAWITGAGGDPWATALPGAYGAGTAGFILGTNLNATISSVTTAVSGIPDLVWDEAIAGHVTPGTFGECVCAAGGGVLTGGDIAAIADAVWDELIAGHVVEGSFGACVCAAGAGGECGECADWPGEVCTTFQW